MNLEVTDKLLDEAEKSEMVEFIALARECRRLRVTNARLTRAIPEAANVLRQVRCCIEGELGTHDIRNRATLVIENAIQTLEEYLL